MPRYQPGPGGPGTARTQKIRAAAKVRAAPRPVKKVTAAKRVQGGSSALDQLLGLLKSPAFERPTFKAPELPEYSAAPTMQSTGQLQDMARQYVDTVYGPQRDLVRQQIAEEAGRSAARANQMRDIYGSLAQYVQGQAGQVQDIYRTAARDMNSFSQGHADAMAMTGQQAASSQNAALNYLGAPQGQMATGDFGASAKFGGYASQGLQALEQAGAGWGSYVATLPGIYSRMGAMDIQQMLGESAERETKLRQGLLELSSKEAGDILDYVTQQQKSQQESYSDWAKGLNEYNQWAFEQKGQAASDYQKALGDYRGDVMDWQKLLFDVQGKREKAGLEREKLGLQGWAAQQKAAQGWTGLGIKGRAVTAGIAKAKAAQRTKDNTLKLAIRKQGWTEKMDAIEGRQKTRADWLSYVAKNNKDGTFRMQYDPTNPRSPWRYERDSTGKLMLTESALRRAQRDDQFNRTLNATLQALGETTRHHKAAEEATWTTLNQRQKVIDQGWKRLAIQEQTARDRATNQKLSAQIRRDALAEAKRYHDLVEKGKAESRQIQREKNKIAQQTAAGKVRQGNVKARGTALSKISDRIFNDMPARFGDKGEAAFGRMYQYYWNRYKLEAQRYNAGPTLDQIIRKAWKSRKAKKPTSGGGGDGSRYYKGGSAGADSNRYYKG